MAITWQLVATKSPRLRTCSNFEAIYWRFFSLRVTKTYFNVPPEGSLSQTWRTLKKAPKKEKAPKEARKLGRLQKKNI